MQQANRGHELVEGLTRREPIGEAEAQQPQQAHAIEQGAEQLLQLIVAAAMHLLQPTRHLRVVALIEGRLEGEWVALLLEDLAPLLSDQAVGALFELTQQLKHALGLKQLLLRQAHMLRQLIEVGTDLGLVELVELPAQQRLEVEQGVLPAPGQDQSRLRRVHRANQDAQLAEQGIDEGLFDAAALGTAIDRLVEQALEPEALGELGEREATEVGHLVGLDQALGHGRDARIQVRLAHPTHGSCSKACVEDEGEGSL